MDEPVRHDFIFGTHKKLKAFPTHIESKKNKQELEAELENIRLRLSKIQDKMYAHNRYGVLLCFQGMDAAGKDSLIREVFKDFNARGVVVHSFKAPNTKELQHDFLWRHAIALPEKGKFAVFNRSHYENVLVTRVNPALILQERHPEVEHIDDLTEEFWNQRLESIRDFENHAQRNGIIILKFFLNLSKEEQRLRLLKRIQKSKHKWKFDPTDMRDRALWDEYMDAYEEAFSKSSQKQAPWYIIPADNKVISRLLVAKIILETLEEYCDIDYPIIAPEMEERLAECRKILEDDTIL
jgi:PPK2 family polyphosphate:nucleotide phosphotransferase